MPVVRTSGTRPRASPPRWRSPSSCGGGPSAGQDPRGRANRGPRPRRVSPARRGLVHHHGRLGSLGCGGSHSGGACLARGSGSPGAPARARTMSELCSPSGSSPAPRCRTSSSAAAMMCTGEPPRARRRRTSQRPSGTPSLPAWAWRIRCAVCLSAGASSSAVYTVTPASMRQTVTPGADILASRPAQTGKMREMSTAPLRLSSSCSILA